jgi:HEAT repeat protein
MLGSQPADFGRRQARVRRATMAAVALAGLLAAGSFGVAAANETQAGKSLGASPKGVELTEKPGRPGDISPETDVGELIAQLTDKGGDIEKSVLAAEVLGEMGVGAESAIGRLVEAIADERQTRKGETVAYAAIYALAKIGRPAVAPLVEALHSDDVHVRLGAAEALGEMGAEAKAAVGALAETLCSLPATGDSDMDDSWAAGAAADALAKIGRPAVPALAEALHHGSEEVRMRAVDALREIGTEAASAAPDLNKLLAAEESYRVRWRALEVYAVAELDKKEVIALLSPLLRDREPKMRSHAAVLLGNLGPQAAAAVATLIDGLDDNRSTRSSRLDPNYGINRPVCCDVAEALGKIGDAARPALPKLSAMMTDDERPTVRISAALAMFQINPANREALRELVRILEEDPEGTGALEAAIALADVGPRGRDAVPALGRTLRHPRFQVRQRAAGALSNIGGPEAVPLLVFASRDPNVMVRWSAVAGLESMGAAAAPALPALIGLLETLDADEEWMDTYPLNLATIEALGEIGPAAARAIPALEKVAQEERYLREAALAALKKIRPAPAGARSAEVETTAPQTEEAAAIDRVEKCGARVTVDQGPSGERSVSVEFWEHWPAVRMGGDFDAAHAWHDEALAHLQRLPRVRSLDLSRARTSDAGLVHLKALTGLESLDLSSTRITDAGLVHLKGLLQLESLNLSGTEVTGPGLENLAGMTRLRKLMLAGRGQATEIGEALSMMGRHRAVHSLDDAALRHFRGLVKLQTLDLSLRSISDAALVHVGQLKELQSLNLYQTQVTDSGLVHLQGLSQLRELDLPHAHVTSAGIKTLQQALPECNIRR